MHLDLTDEEAAALTQELHEIVENDRYPFSPRIRTLRGIPRQAQTGAGSRALATAEGVCATTVRPAPSPSPSPEKSEATDPKPIAI
jgi:hypothetical protein